MALRVTFRAALSVFLAGLACVLSLCVAGQAAACDTPVYRYAMYRWEPAPYQIYYFYRGVMDQKAERIKELIDAAERSEKKPANVTFIAVDLDKDPLLRSVPPYVKHDWLPRQEPAIASDLPDTPSPYLPVGLQPFARPELPSYQVVAPPPYFMKMYSGDLDESEIAAFLDSPARQQIAKQLEAGKASVLVMLTGTDDAANQEAEKATKKVIQDLAAGKVELYLPPSFPADEGDTEEKGPSIEFGFVKVDRSDPKEYWVVESLLSMEEDLKDEQWVDKPMIFAVFGRGRALPPFVGKGINEDNLLDCVYFVTGACSCTVKDQNPGMDLLFTYDWYTAADNLAKKYGAEEGNEYSMGAEDYFPDLIIPEETQQDQGDGAASAEAEQPKDATHVASTQPGDGMETTDGAGAEVPEGKDTVTEKPKEPAAAADTETPKPTPQDANSDDAVAAVTEPPENEPTNAAMEPESDSEGTAFSSVLIVGAGLAVALVTLFGLTFLVLRPK